MLKTGGGALAVALAAPGLAFAQTPKRGGTLRVSNGGDPPDFDLHQAVTYLTQFIGAPCYSTLLQIDPNNYNKLLPDLAEGVRRLGRRKKRNVPAPRGVIFHNGMTLTADDVIYSLERIRKPPAGIVSVRKGMLGNIADIQAVTPAWS